MANELEITLSATYEDANDIVKSFGVTKLQRTVSNKYPFGNTQSVGTAEEAIRLGEGVTLGYCFLKNLDGTNYVEIKVGTGGAIFAKLMPGDICVVPLGSGAQVPFAIANTLACDLEVLIIPR